MCGDSVSTTNKQTIQIITQARILIYIKKILEIICQQEKAVYIFWMIKI